MIRFVNSIGSFRRSSLSVDCSQQLNFTIRKPFRCALSVVYKRFTLSTIATKNVDPLTAERLQLLQALDFIPKKVEAIQSSTSMHQELFGPPHEVPDNTALYLRQIHLERMQEQAAKITYANSFKNLIQLGKGTGLKFIQKSLVSWYGPLCAEIAAEIELFKDCVPGGINRLVSLIQSKKYPFLLLRCLFMFVLFSPGC